MILLYAYSVKGFTLMEITYPSPPIFAFVCVFENQEVDA